MIFEFDTGVLPVSLVDSINDYRDGKLISSNCESSDKVLMQGADYGYWVLSYLVYLHENNLK